MKALLPAVASLVAIEASAQAVVRAVKLAAPLTGDGRLDEDLYKSQPGVNSLVQVAPNYGKPMTERTDLWVSYDNQNIYVSCRCWDSAPPDQWVVNELRRDTGGLRNNDHIGVMFDTFFDRRSGFAFYTNPLGARAD